MEPAARPIAVRLPGVAILLVDPDLDSLELLEGLLAELDAVVDTASDATSALAALRRLPPEVVLVDLPPGASRAAFLLSARAQCPNLFAVAVSAYAAVKDRDDALREGFDRYLSKPLDVPAVIGLLAEHASTIAIPRGPTTLLPFEPSERASDVDAARGVATDASATVVAISEFLERRARAKGKPLPARGGVRRKAATPDVLDDVLEELRAIEEELRVANEQLRDGGDAMARVLADSAAEVRRHQRHLDQLPDGFVVTDMRGVITHANQTLATLLNVDARFLVGRPLVTFLIRADCQALHEALDELAAKGRLRGLRVRLRPRQSGIAFDADLNAWLDTAERVVRWTVREADTVVHATTDLGRSAEESVRVERPPAQARESDRETPTP